jgi:hypothetical protein
MWYVPAYFGSVVSPNSTFLPDGIDGSATR